MHGYLIRLTEEAHYKENKKIKGMRKDPNPALLALVKPFERGYRLRGITLLRTNHDGKGG
jgi:hypothetical protein